MRIFQLFCYFFPKPSACPVSALTGFHHMRHSHCGHNSRNIRDTSDLDYWYSPIRCGMAGTAQFDNKYLIHRAHLLIGIVSNCTVLHCMTRAVCWVAASRHWLLPQCCRLPGRQNRRPFPEYRAASSVFGHRGSAYSMWYG